MYIINYIFFVYVIKCIDVFIKFSKLYINILIVFYLFLIIVCNLYYYKLNG